MNRPARSAFALASIALVSLSGAAPAAEVAGVELRLLANGLAEPVALAHAGDDRIFIAEQAGKIRVLKEGALLETPYLDLRNRVLYGGEQGLLGLAFHPRYADNGWLFVSYTREGDGASVLSRFTRSALDSDRGDPASEAILLVVPQPYANHNGGNLAFGPNGYLHFGLGDGGGVGDPGCRAQNRDELLGKMLRLDVDTHADTPPYHAVPPSNPFAGAIPGADLVWALGLRNPQRFSFDRRSGFLFLPDVGQGAFDEVNFAYADEPQAVNWGWKVMEAHACYSSAGCPASTPPCNAEALFVPEIVRPRTGGHCGLIGGYAYHGHRLPALEGRYLLGDYCTGNLYAVRGSSGGLVLDDLPFDLPTLTTFGETRVGEILLATLSGQLYTLDRPVTTSCIPGPTRACLLGGRFEVEVSFRDYELDRGDGRVVVDGPGSVLFWFFDDEVWEQIVKVIDGCAYNQRYWVYGAAATDVETVLRVTDTLHGVVREYANSLGAPASAVTDSAAFSTCP